MKSPIAGAFALIVGTMMAVSGGFDLGQALNEPFDYQAATNAERTEFLQATAVPISKSLKLALISPSGIGPKFRLRETEVHPARREILFVIKVDGELQRGQGFRDAKTAMFKRLCPIYLPSPIGRNNVKLTQRYVGRDNRTFVNVTVSNSVCRRYART